MNRRLQAGVFLILAVLAGAIGSYLSSGSMSSKQAEGAVRRLMLGSLSDQNGKLQMMSRWRGKILVVNFWATWCAPCREEIPALMRVQRKHASNGVQIVGIAIDDAAKVREYANEMHIDYVLLIGGIETVGMTKDLGNSAGVLPFTAVLDREGKLIYARAGALTEASLGAVLTPLL